MLAKSKPSSSACTARWTRSFGRNSSLERVYPSWTMGVISFLTRLTADIRPADGLPFPLLTFCATAPPLPPHAYRGRASPMETRNHHEYRLDLAVRALAQAPRCLCLARHLRAERGVDRPRHQPALGRFHLARHGELRRQRADPGDL